MTIPARARIELRGGIVTKERVSNEGGPCGMKEIKEIKDVFQHNPVTCLHNNSHGPCHGNVNLFTSYSSIQKPPRDTRITLFFNQPQLQSIDNGSSPRSSHPPQNVRRPSRPCHRKWRASGYARQPHRRSSRFQGTSQIRTTPFLYLTLIPPPLPGLRGKSCVLHNGRRAEDVLCARTERHVLFFLPFSSCHCSPSPASQYRSSSAVPAPQAMVSSPCPAQRLHNKQSSPSTVRNSKAETSSSRLPNQPNKRTMKIRREGPRDVQAGAVPKPCPAKSPRPRQTATSKRMTLLLFPVPTKQPSPRKRRSSL